MSAEYLKAVAEENADLKRAREEALATITKRPRCRYCEKELRPYKRFDPRQGEKPAFGAYGDWVFCGLRCGYNFAVDSLGASPRHRP